MVGVGRDLWGSSGPTPLPKQGHLEQAALHSPVDFLTGHMGLLKGERDLLITP